MLINVKLSTIVCIVTFINMIDVTSESLKARFFRHYVFYQQLKFHAQLSEHELFYNLEASSAK